MENILQKEIANCLKALQQPNRTVDNYRCYYEGRKALAEELLPQLQQADVMRSEQLPPLNKEQAEKMVLQVWNAGMDAEEVGMPSFDMAKGSKFIKDIVDRLCDNNR